MSEQTTQAACAGRVALVTGASQGGTGTAIAVRLAAEGARVALTARSREGLDETAERVAEVGGTALVLPADLSDPDGERGRLVERAEAALGPVDILVNSAAAGGYKPFEKWTTTALERLMQLNLWAPWELMKDVLPGMRERRRGWILNLTSFTGELPPGPPFPESIPSKAGAGYGASKAALNRLTIAAASETEGQGIAVNALTPQAAIATRRLVTAGRIGEHWIEPAGDDGGGGPGAVHLRTLAADRPDRLQPAAPARIAASRPGSRRALSGRRLAARRSARGHRATARGARAGGLAMRLRLRAPEQSVHRHPGHRPERLNRPHGSNRRTRSEAGARGGAGRFTRGKTGRGGRIRTGDHVLPKHVRYQTAPLPGRGEGAGTVHERPGTGNRPRRGRADRLSRRAAGGRGHRKEPGSWGGRRAALRPGG